MHAPPPLHTSIAGSFAHDTLRVRVPEILRKTRDALEPGGAFLVYQFSTRVLRDLTRIFGYVGRRFELLNVLPAHLFICQPITA